MSMIHTWWDANPTQQQHIKTFLVNMTQKRASTWYLTEDGSMDLLTVEHALECGHKVGDILALVEQYSQTMYAFGIACEMQTIQVRQYMHLTTSGLEIMK